MPTYLGNSTMKCSKIILHVTAFDTLLRRLWNPFRNPSTTTEILSWKTPWSARQMLYGKLRVRRTGTADNTNQSRCLNRSRNQLNHMSLQNYKSIRHKNRNKHCSGNLEARKLVSNVNRALLPASVHLLVLKALKFFYCIHTKTCRYIKPLLSQAICIPTNFPKFAYLPVHCIRSSQMKSGHHA
jgi:hypothetical protein